MAVGPVSRLINLKKKEYDWACFIHNDKCHLWPDFLRQHHKSRRIFENLARTTGRHVFIVNYPPEKFARREIFQRGYRILQIKYLRDGRANLYSKMRHDVPRFSVPAVDSILDWQIPYMDRLDQEIEMHPVPNMLLRYEDLLNRPDATMQDVGAFVGLDYDEDAIRFWEHEHHFTAGNTAVLDIITRMQGREGWRHHRSDAYLPYYDRIKEDPDTRFVDDEWSKEMKRDDLLAFDCLLGERNAAHGYPRDTFTDGERASFWADFRMRPQPVPNGRKTWLERISSMSPIRRHLSKSSD